MASPQLEEGYTQLANEVIEAMARLVLNSGESRCLWHIWRQTYGYHRKEDRISLGQFVEATGMNIGHVCESLSSLKGRKVISVTQTGHSKTYGFQKDYLQWDAKGRQGRRGDTNAPYMAQQDLVNTKTSEGMEVSLITKTSTPQPLVNTKSSADSEDLVNTKTCEPEDLVFTKSQVLVNTKTQKKERKSLTKNDKRDDSSVPEESSEKPKGRPLGPPDEDPYAYELAVAEVLGYGDGYPNKKEACAHAKAAQKSGITCNEAMACAEWMLRVNGAFWANQTMQIASIVRQIPAYRKSLVESGSEYEAEGTQSRYREVIFEPLPRAVAIFWSKALENLKAKVNRLTFNTWSENLSPVSINGSNVVIGAANETILDTVARYRSHFAEALSKVAGKAMDVEFVLIAEVVPA